MDTFKDIIDYYVARHEPIIITLSLAMCRINNSLKFREKVPYPTFAWMHLAWFFKFMNDKVRRCYEPGIKVVIFDEGTLFHGVAGVDFRSVTTCIEASRRIFRIMGSPIEVIEMERNMFPDHLEPQPVSPERIYAMACSMPDMETYRAMDNLYKSRKRDYNELRQIIGKEIWQKAEYAAGMVSSVLAWRKRSNLFGKILEGRLYIDACITQKDQRLVLAISSCTLINHGLPLIKKNGKYKMIVVPEARINTEWPEAEPVLLDSQEFDSEKGLYTFYYSLS